MPKFLEPISGLEPKYAGRKFNCSMAQKYYISDLEVFRSLLMLVINDKNHPIYEHLYVSLPYLIYILM